MFGVEDGFDIVIGNPPYIQLQKDGGKLAKMYENQGYQTFARTGDIYSLFYEKGYQILKPKGILAYITSNKWMRAGYGEATRSFFAEKTNRVGENCFLRMTFLEMAVAYSFLITSSRCVSPVFSVSNDAISLLSPSISEFIEKIRLFISFID